MYVHQHSKCLLAEHTSMFQKRQVLNTEDVETEDNLPQHNISNVYFSSILS